MDSPNLTEAEREALRETYPRWMMLRHASLIEKGLLEARYYGALAEVYLTHAGRAVVEGLEGER